MIIIGCIGAPWGVKGHTRIISYASPGSQIFDYKTWYLGDEQQLALKQVEVADKGIHSKQMVARLAHIADRDQAQLLVHQKIYVKREDFPSLEVGEYYWQDLKGLEVVSQEGSLGHIKELYETGAHDNMIVQNDKQLVHIPFVMGEIVQKVDFQAKLVTVDWELGD